MKFKVNDEHKRICNDEVYEIISSMPYDRDHDDIIKTSKEITNYFCEWIEKIMNKKTKKEATKK